jgi:hypothetical protein
VSNEQRAHDIVLAESAAHKMMRDQQVDSVKQEVRYNDIHLGRLVGDDCRPVNGSWRGSGE